jgi:carbamoyltransferase
MNILGISCFYHDSSAALLKDGQLVAAVEEERFRRRKHYSGFPKHAVAYCLEQGGLTIDEVDYIGFYEKPMLKFQCILHGVLGTFPRSWRAFLRAMPMWLTRNLQVPAIIRQETAYRGPILFVEHHVAHAASAFFVSPFEEAAILTVDGVGEWATTTCGMGRGNTFELSREIRFPDSLGLLYSAVTRYLGFEVNEGEGKVMGLAPYGRPVYRRQFEDVIDVKPDGSFRLNLDYFAYHYGVEMFSPKFERVFGPRRSKDESLNEHYTNMAATVEAVLEDTVLAIARELKRTTRARHLCIAGGVGLSSCSNGRILREVPFDDLFVQPAAGDGGTSVGVATYIHCMLLGHPRHYVMRHAYLGPESSDEEIEAYLLEHRIPYQRLPDRELVQTTARLLAEQRIVGWFQGRMEFGPRALGHRSILADPRDPKMKDIVNARVKHREAFRPFAPSVLLEASPDFFACPVASPFMLLVADVHPDKRALVPAITHVDGTARLQTVTREENGLYYDLIAEFGRRTGVPVIFNTSFNDKGEAIVRTPEDAYNCFANTGMDYLVMGHFLVGKDALPS